MKFILMFVLLVTGVALAQAGDTFTTTNYHVKRGLGLNKAPIVSSFVNHSFPESDDSLPVSFDWRTLNGVSPVKNQGSTGDCWAFSATGAFEAQLLIKKQEAVSLSEQYLNDCNPYGYNGTSGGDFPILAFQVNPGQPVLSDYPWAERNQRCKKGVALFDHLGSYGYVGGSGESVNPTVDQIRAALVQYGPLSVDVAVGNGFQSYQSGVLNRNDRAEINHMVLIVGYDHSKGYWIVKNSWGTSWGESGYLRIAYGIDQIAETTAYVTYP